MSKAVEKVYKFELKIYGIKSDAKEKELHRGPKNEYALRLSMLDTNLVLFTNSCISYLIHSVLSCSVNFSVAVTLRHKVLWSIYQQMLKNHEDFFGNDLKKYFYDCGINFYSVNKLFDRSEGEREFKINIVCFFFIVFYHVTVYLLHVFIRSKIFRTIFNSDISWLYHPIT